MQAVECGLAVTGFEGHAGHFDEFYAEGTREFLTAGFGGDDPFGMPIAQGLGGGIAVVLMQLVGDEGVGLVDGDVGFGGDESFDLFDEAEEFLIVGTSILMEFVVVDAVHADHPEHGNDERATRAANVEEEGNGTTEECGGDKSPDLGLIDPRKKEGNKNED